MKGQTYSLLAILVLIPVIIFVLGFLATSQEVTTERVDRVVGDEMAQVARNMEDDFARAVEISARRAFLSEVNQILLTGEPMDNATERTIELMTNGSLYDNLSLIMYNNTLQNWRDKILQVEVGFTKNLSYYDIGIRNIDGFNLMVTITLQINLSHQLSSSRITRVTTREVPVSIEGLDDPLYIMESNGNVKKQILKFPHNSHAIKLFTGTRLGNCTGAVTFSGPGGILVTNDATAASGYTGIVSETAGLPSVSCYSLNNPGAVQGTNSSIQEQNYSTLILDEFTGVWLAPMVSGLQFYSTHPSSGPDLLARLEGRLDTTENGLESFVIGEAGITEKPGQSRVDYKYFSGSVIPGNTVRWFPTWLLLDSESAGKYNLTELLE